MPRTPLAASAAAVPALAAAMFAGPALAETQTFDFEDPKGCNGIGILLDSKLEPFFGMATTVTGTIEFDPAQPDSFVGELQVPIASIEMSNDRMTQVLHSARWLDAEKFGQVSFTFDKVENQTSDGDAGVLVVAGTFTYADVSIPKKVNIRYEFLPDAAADRGGAEEGDLLVLRSNFTLSRLDLGIQEEVGTDTVADEIQLTVAIAGYAE